ncbi:MAG: Nramp family divalent metal transporter [Acidobacteriota bacterium]
MAAKRAGRSRFGLGPGLVVSAAFIGPGTVTTCTLAGAKRGVDLLWALAFSVLATIVLQEAAARIGLVSRSGLGEALMGRARSRWHRSGLVVLVAWGLGFGCAAYQGGNLTGAALGLQAVLGGSLLFWVLVVAGTATLLLSTGSYRVVERTLMILVTVMGLAFLTAAVMSHPRLGHLAAGLTRPMVHSGDAVLILALVGTTVVPYNLFLHASACVERWAGPADMVSARLDTFLSILAGGIVSAAIVITASSLKGGPVPASVQDLAHQLVPLLGERASLFFGLGLLGAGLSSAITAPLAAAYAVAGFFGWPRNGRRFRAVWQGVMLAGIAGVVLTVRVPPGNILHVAPLRAIMLALAANGLLLPLLSLALLAASNDQRLLGKWRNGWPANIAGGIVGLFMLILGGWAILRVLGRT